MYRNHGRVETFLARSDGRKIFGRKYWDLRTLREQIAQLTTNLNAMKRSSGGSRELKKIKKDRQTFARYKSDLEKCGKPRTPSDGPKLIRFGNVKGILNDACVQCHLPLGWENTQEFYLSTGRVTPGDLEASPLYVFLSNTPEKYQPGYMPKGMPPMSDLNLMLISRWIRDLGSNDHVPATPTPGGEEGEGRNLYAQYCSACHGVIDVSAKFGRSQAQILAALGSGGIPQMRHLRLSSEQIRKISLALSRVQPPREGSVAVRSLGPVAEGGSADAPHAVRFAITFTGTSSQPFTVGYVTSNGTALAGSDFVFDAGSVQFQGTNGETKFVDVAIVGDEIQEPDESLFLDIGGVSHGGVRVATSTAAGIIQNDDVFHENVPPAGASVRMSYGFNGDYHDGVGHQDATPQGDATLSATARVGSGALELDEGPDLVQIPGLNLQGATNFSLTAWVYWTNTTSTTSRVLDFGSSTTNYLYFTPKDATNRCRFELRIAGSVYPVQCNTNVSLPGNSWVHVGLVYNSATSEAKIFFNGTQVATRSSVVLTLPNLIFSDNRLGNSRVSGNADFAGKIDELMVWDSALSASDIGAVMAMTESAQVSSAIEVRVNNQLLANGTELNLGQIQVGDEDNLSLFITSRGPGGLALQGEPLVSVAGLNANEFVVKHQPWPWQELLSRGALAVFSLRHAPREPGLKTATLVIRNSDLRDGNYAITLRATDSGDAIEDPDAPADQSSEVGQGQTLYAVNCASCHGAIANSQKRGVTLERLTTALNPQQGVAQMRGLGLSADQIRLVTLALNSPAPDSSDTLQAEDTLVNIGTANYVNSALKDVFLPTDEATYTADDINIKARISENILGLRSNNSVISGRIRNFGGRCDRFEDLCQAEATMSPQRPVPNAIRAALILKACDEVLSIDRAVDNVLGKIGRTVASPIDAQATKDLYQIFMPGRELPQYLADVIANYSQGRAALNARDHWRFQAHLMCASNDWEGL